MYIPSLPLPAKQALQKKSQSPTPSGATGSTSLANKATRSQNLYLYGQQQIKQYKGQKYSIF